jgi:hypothetical protein
LYRSILRTARTWEGGAQVGLLLLLLLLLLLNTTRQACCMHVNHLLPIKA